MCGCSGKPCKKAALNLEISWNALKLTDHAEPIELNNDEIALRPLQLYSTQFRNFSDCEQTFTFRAERQTQSSVEFQVQEGVSIGGSMSLNFSLPAAGATARNGLKMTGGLMSSQIAWNHSASEKFSKSETLTWSVGSQVNQFLALLGQNDIILTSCASIRRPPPTQFLKWRSKNISGFRPLYNQYN